MYNGKKLPRSVLVGAAIVALVGGLVYVAQAPAQVSVITTDVASEVFGEANKKCVKRSAENFCSEAAQGCPATCHWAVCDAPEDTCYSCPQPPAGDVWRCDGADEPCTTGTNGPQTSCGKKLKGTCTNTTCTPDDEPCQGNCNFEATISTEDCPTISTHGCVH